MNLMPLLTTPDAARAFVDQLDQLITLDDPDLAVLACMNWRVITRNFNGWLMGFL